MFWKLPPVRTPVRSVRRLNRADDSRVVFGRKMQLYGSGTQALARALLACKQQRPGARDVLIPAYACPDLVAACVFAGLAPRLIDLADDASWRLNIRQVETLAGSSTAAIVAMNFLGVGDGVQELLTIADRLRIPVIQDSAQALSRRAIGQWQAKYVVLSFGRGKPLNLLGGGALLTQDGLLDAHDPAVSQQTPLRERLLHGRAAALLFNTATHPRFYWLASRLPGLRVGATTYRPLRAIAVAPDSRYEQVECALTAHVANHADSAADWREAAAGWTRHGIRTLPGSEAGTDLLRFPVLARDAQQRERLSSAMQKLGVGCSAMYERALNEIPGVPADVVAQGPFPAARSFASRLLTLPTHSFVTPEIISLVDRCIGRVA